jgi:CheY-like chemotaxis protein
MNNNKPIIIIDDDDEDLDLIRDALAELKVENEIIVFDDGVKFIDFIRATDNKAFFILCDVNMSKINGLELKKMIYDDEHLRLKCVPFIFMSTSGASTEVMRAYSYGVQGYFIKPPSFGEIKDLLHSIFRYWSHSQHPGS